MKTHHNRKNAPEDLEKAKRKAYGDMVERIRLYKEQLKQSRELFKKCIDKGAKYVYCSRVLYSDVCMVVSVMDVDVEVIGLPEIEIGRLYFTAEALPGTVSGKKA